MARVVGRTLYASVDSGSGLIDTLLCYDLDTGRSRTRFTVPADIAWITVNESWLLWESEKQLYAEPVAGGRRQVLATSREAYGPTLEGDIAAWVDHEEGSDSRIVTVNLRTSEKREIARTHVAEFYNNFMQLRDGKLLWTDIYDGSGHYVVHDLSTGKARDYPMPATRFRYPGYAIRTGDSVYSINFDRYDRWDWSVQQVGRYSLTTGSFTPITGPGGYVNALVVGRRCRGDHRLGPAPSGRRIRRRLPDEGPERDVRNDRGWRSSVQRRNHGGRGSVLAREEQDQTVHLRTPLGTRSSNGIPEQRLELVRIAAVRVSEVDLMVAAGHLVPLSLGEGEEPTDGTWLIGVGADM